MLEDFSRQHHVIVPVQYENKINRFSTLGKQVIDLLEISNPDESLQMSLIIYFSRAFCDIYECPVTAVNLHPLFRKEDFPKSVDNCNAMSVLYTRPIRWGWNEQEMQSFIGRFNH